MVLRRAGVSKKRCPKCGEETITQCPQCGTEIEGYLHLPGVAYIGPEDPPVFCHECGAEYPWTKKSKEKDKMADPARAPTTDVFVVHGHDGEMKEAVARVLSRLGLNPIILHEKPNGGRTLIEKFEKNADVDFAVVLLSPDDVAHAKGAPPTTARPRARQNVVLELGYFTGRLGRDHVFALKREGELELPSDFVGVAYTPFDAAGQWKYELVRELREAGFDVNANALL